MTVTAERSRLKQITQSTCLKGDLNIKYNVYICIVLKQVYFSCFFCPPWIQNGSRNKVPPLPHLHNLLIAGIVLIIPMIHMVLKKAFHFLYIGIICDMACCRYVFYSPFLIKKEMN